MILNKGADNCAQQRCAVSTSHPLRLGDALNGGLRRLGRIRSPRTQPAFGTSIAGSVSEAEAHLGAQQQQQQQRLAICFDLYHQIKIFLTRTKAEVRARLLQLLLFFLYIKLLSSEWSCITLTLQWVVWIFYSLPFSLQANSPSDQCSNALMKNLWAASQEYIIHQISVSWPERAARANPDYPCT